MRPNIKGSDGLLEGDTSLSSEIPWRNHVDENTLGNDRNDLMQIAQLSGASTVGLSESELASDLDSRTRAFQSASNPNLGVYIYCVKRKVQGQRYNEVRGLARYPAELAQSIRQDLAGNTFTIAWYVCFILSPPLSKKLKVLDYFKKSLATDQQSSLIERVDSLHKMTARFCSQQSRYSPRLLGIFKKEDGLFSEPARFLRYITQHTWDDVPFSPTLLNQRIASTRVRFDRKTGLVRVGDSFCKNTNPLEFDQYLPSGCMRALLESKFEVTFCIAFRYILRADAQDKIRLNIKQLEGVGDDAISQIDAMRKGLDMLASGEISFTRSFMSMSVFGQSEHSVSANLEDFKSRFSDSSFFLMSQNALTAKAVYLSQIPGNWNYAVRNTNGLHTLNIAALADFGGVPTGSFSSEWSDIAPLLTVSTEHKTPFHFNLHQAGSDVPHSTITGQSGGGKTVLLAVIIAMATRFNTKLFLLDIERGQEIFVKALGGIYTIVEPGKSTGWNPFDLPFSAETASFVSRLVAQLMALSGVRLSADANNRITDAVRMVFDLPKKDRRLGVLGSYLPSGDEDYLKEGLSQWIGSGARSWIFDAESNSALEFGNRYYGFDMTKLSEDKEVGAVIFSFLSFAAENYMVDGDPVIFALEEGWAWLESELAAERVKHWYRTGRRNKIALVLATNNADVISGTNTGRELAKQSPTNIFLASPRSKPEDYAAFDLTDSQIQRIISMTPGARQFALKQGDDFVVLDFDLSGAADHLEVISGRKETLPLVSECQTCAGFEPEDWVPLFIEKAKALRHQKRNV